MFPVTELPLILKSSPDSNSRELPSGKGDDGIYCLRTWGDFVLVSCMSFVVLFTGFPPPHPAPLPRIHDRVFLVVPIIF